MTLEGDELQRLNAKIESVSEATSLLSFPIVGFLAYRFGIGLMILDALFLLMGALALLPYLGVEVTRKESPQEEPTSMIIGRKLIVGFIATLLLFNFAIASSRIFVFSSLKSASFGELLYGSLQSVRNIGGLLAAISLAIFIARKDLRKAIFVGMAFESLAVLLLGLPSVYLLFAGMLLLGIGGQALNISMSSLFQKVIPMESLGTFRGVFDALATLIIPLSQLTFALLIEHGFSVSLLALGAFWLGIGSGVLMLRMLQDVSTSTTQT
ncbi:MFS transporter [Thermococcus sp. LS2]|uniref:MFS transporter n=1 Tax=Thermococcus sp. LS2 TaxID=1638260 RepID=UPI001439E737|nr:MFS transporter [Thermococcus sp. LS2]NJE13562.1 hypothetical protein [Thermococcus sp. LS2]